MGTLERAPLPDATRSEIARYDGMIAERIITPEKMRVTILEATNLLR